MHALPLEYPDSVTGRRIPVACVQTQAADRTQFTENWPRYLALVDAAGRGGAQLIVLPEGTVPGYVLGTDPVPAALLERAQSDLAQLAEKHHATVVFGIVRHHDGRQFNAASVLGPDGSELGWSAKQFLWHFDRRWFEAGATLEPIETPHGRLGVLVCADGRIPTIAATLVERGAEMLVMPTAWVTSGRDPAALENVQADLFVTVRARENGVPFIAANKTGVEQESVAYCGKSAIVDGTGCFVARAGEREEVTLHGVVTLGAGRATPGSRFDWDAIDDDEPRVPAHRIAFTLAPSNELARFEALAKQGDADLLIGPDDGPERLIEGAGIRYGLVHSGTVQNPRGLVRARLAGVDLFVWSAEGLEDWIARYARTRALELRAYVLVLDRPHERAYAVDPDGVVVAGTFEAYRLAAFTYDRTRTQNGLVAPGTDIFTGLRTAEAIRAQTAPALAARRG